MEEPNDLNGPLYLGWYEELNEGVEEQHVGGEDGCEEVTDWEDHSDSDLGSIVGSDPEYQEVVGGLRQKKKKLMKEYSEVKKAINELKKGGKNTKGNSEGNGKRAKHGGRKSKLKGKACEAEYDDVGDGEGDGFVGYYGWYDDVFDDEDDGLAGDEGAGTSNPTTGANEGGLNEANTGAADTQDAEKVKEKKRKYEAARRAYKSLPVVINAGGAAKYVHSDEPAQCGEEAHFKGHERGGRRGRYESSSSEEDQYVFPSKPPPPVENDTRFLGETDMYYNEEWEIPYFQAGMRFKNGAQFKKAIQKYWQKTGVPCSHLVRVCWLKGWKPEDFISPYLKLEMYKHAYNEPMHCTRSRDMWVNFNGPRLEPPVLKRRPGRPKKNRIPSTGELRRDKGGKKFAYVSKQGLRMRCGGCQGQGHNTRTCPKLRGTSTGTQFQGSRFQAHHNPYDVTEEDYIAFFRQVNDDENISSSQVTEPGLERCWKWN